MIDPTTPTEVLAKRNSKGWKPNAPGQSILRPRGLYGAAYVVATDQQLDRIEKLKRTKATLMVVVAAALIATVLPFRSDADEALTMDGVVVASPQQSRRFSPPGYASVYEATLIGCQRGPELMCSVAIRRVNSAPDNGLFIAAQKDSFVSSIADGNHRHYPATRAVIAGTKAGDRSGVLKAFASGEEVTFDLSFAASPSIGNTIRELTISMIPAVVVNFSQIPVR